MVLLFDIGNTNIVLGIVKNDRIVNTYRFVTNIDLTEDDYYQKISSVLNLYKDETVDGAIISSVVPQIDPIFNHMLEKYFGIKAKNVGPGIKSGLTIKLENPKQAGADLLCDAIGAYHLYGGTSIIVDLGTATKLIVVNDKKEFLGGVICAGLKGSLESLINSTSKLSRTALIAPEKVINNETSLCIQSGIVHGHVAMIDGLIESFKKELKTDNVNVVLTGGYAVIIKDLLKSKVIYNPNVLLDGLYYIYQKNTK